MISLKRIYDPAEESDGFRILVDRLWPRGVSKEKAKFDLWLKDIAPSTELRKWFSHDISKWSEFKKRYLSELKQNTQETEKLTEIIKKNKTVTLLFAAKDIVHNEAQILKDYFKISNKI